MFGQVHHLPPPRPEQTLAWMRKFALQGEDSPQIRQLAEHITRGVRQRDYLSEYAAILNWVRKNIRYTRDPRTIEQVSAPISTVQRKTGDCDDMATLLAALVLSVGGQVRFCAGAFAQSPMGADGKKMPSHVWAEAFDPGSNQWIVLDPVPGHGRRVGEMLNHVQRRVTMPVA